MGMACLRPVVTQQQAQSRSMVAFQTLASMIGFLAKDLVEFYAHHCSYYPGMRILKCCAVRNGLGVEHDHIGKVTILQAAAVSNFQITGRQRGEFVNSWQ
jgi:hypothetical protein